MADSEDETDQLPLISCQGTVTRGHRPAEESNRVCLLDEHRPEAISGRVTLHDEGLGEVWQGQHRS
jgi:hypothetical protein